MIEQNLLKRLNNLIKMENINIDEVKRKVEKKLKVSYYYILYSLLDIKLNEFSEKEIKTNRDINLLLSLRKYFGIGQVDETFKSFVKEIKENLKVI